MTTATENEVQREPIEWDGPITDHPRDPTFEEVRAGDIVWPCIGRPGEWPCLVLKKNDDLRAMLVEVSFDGLERWQMRPVFLILDETLRVQAGCQDRELMIWRLENFDF